MPAETSNENRLNVATLPRWREVPEVGTKGWGITANAVDVQTGESQTAIGRSGGDGHVKGPFLVDGHVHYYPCFDRNLFLDSAFRNFREAGNGAGTSAEYAGWLLFTESAGMNYFREFRAVAGQRSAGWTFQRTDEPDSLIAKKEIDARLLLIAGRQIVTSEGLEVLALCCSHEFPNGLTLATTVRAVNAAGAVAVLPWGFGKWWFRRETLITDFIRAGGPAAVFLGDNGGRPDLGRRPRAFRIAKSRQIEILPGTDPLPLDREAQRVGGYGFTIDGVIAPAHPAAGLRRLLHAGANRPVPYGRQITAVALCRNQLLFRLGYLFRRRVVPGSEQRST